MGEVYSSTLSIRSLPGSRTGSAAAADAAVCGVPWNCLRNAGCLSFSCVAVPSPALTTIVPESAERDPWIRVVPLSCTFMVPLAIVPSPQLMAACDRLEVKAQPPGRTTIGPVVPAWIAATSNS